MHKYRPDVGNVCKRGTYATAGSFVPRISLLNPVTIVTGGGARAGITAGQSEQGRGRFSIRVGVGWPACGRRRDPFRRFVPARSKKIPNLRRRFRLRVSFSHSAPASWFVIGRLLKASSTIDSSRSPLSLPTWCSEPSVCSWGAPSRRKGRQDRAGKGGKRGEHVVGILWKHDLLRAVF